MLNYECSFLALESQKFQEIRFPSVNWMLRSNKNILGTLLFNDNHMDYMIYDIWIW